jgi:hypothetical protein
MSTEASVEDVHTFGLDMMSAALEAPTKQQAVDAVVAMVRDLDGDTAQRVAAMLAVECVRGIRPRRSRRELRDWILRRRFTVQMHGVELGDV